MTTCLKNILALLDVELSRLKTTNGCKTRTSIDVEFLQNLELKAKMLRSSMILNDLLSGKTNEEVQKKYHESASRVRIIRRVYIGTATKQPLRGVD